jgi:hypothetical protein
MNEISSLERYKIAVQMHMFQHQRWNQWCLFFFGSIGAVFALWSQAKAFVPLYVPAFFGAVISVAWIYSALGIRAQNRVWENIIKDIEEAPGVEMKIHQEFVSRRADFDTWREFVETLKFWEPLTRYSVSRHLIWFGMVSTLVFVVVFCVGIRHPYPAEASSGALKTITTTTTTTAAPQQ